MYTGIVFVEETDGLEPPLAVISSPRSWLAIRSQFCAQGGVVLGKENIR